MQALLKNVNSFSFKIKRKSYTIDNAGFKFHYKLTTMLIIILTIIATTQELIGEHIKCIADKGVPGEEKVINTFCYFMSTFTVDRYLNSDMINAHEVAHPGVGAIGINDEEEDVTYHAYYQWVPFVLMLQALAFSVPHAIWKHKEDGVMKKLTSGLEWAAFATDRKIAVGKDTVPSEEEVLKKFQQLNTLFKNHILVNRRWTPWLITCECLNLVNLIIQIWLTNIFLGYQFLSLGIKLIDEGLSDSVDILDAVFPKITKCTFHKYGPSGSIQSKDAMCVMASNVINEKVYVILWFWFVLLGIVSIVSIVWRILTTILYSRSVGFNRWTFTRGSTGKLDPTIIRAVMRHCGYGDWLFLAYMEVNMDGRVFKKFLQVLAEELTIDYHGYDTLPISEKYD